MFTACPLLDSRPMMAILNGEGCRINRKRTQWLTCKMGIAALGPKRRTTKAGAGTQDLPVSLALD